MSFISSLVAKAAIARANSTATKNQNTSSVNPLVSAINKAVSASKSISSKTTPVSLNPVSSAIKKVSSDSGIAKTLAPKILTPQSGAVADVYDKVTTLAPKTLAPKILTPQSGAVAGVSDNVTTLAPKILTTDKTSTPTNSKASEIEDEDEIRRNKIIAEGKALADKALAEKVASNNANAVAKESTNTEQASVVSPSVIPGVDYKSLMDKAVAQQQRNAAVNTAQTRNLAQEQAYQAGAKVGSADASNYVNRALAQADAANVAGAQGLQDSLLSYQKSAESQQNWQKQFDQSSKQADLANERARYDQIVSAIGSDNPDALSYFAKQYLGGVPIDKAYSDTLTKGFTAKTAKDKAYEELETWQPEIEEYLRIQNEQGQVAADNYLKAHPIPTEFIPTNTASDTAVQSQSIANVESFSKSYKSNYKDGKYTSWEGSQSEKPPIEDIVLAYQSGNKSAIKSINSIAISIPHSVDTPEFANAVSTGQIVKDANGNIYYVDTVYRAQAGGKKRGQVVLIDLKTGNKLISDRYKGMTTAY